MIALVVSDWDLMPSRGFLPTMEGDWWGEGQGAGRAVWDDVILLSFYFAVLPSLPWDFIHMPAHLPPRHKGGIRVNSKSCLF